MDQVREQIKRRTATVRQERGASSLGRRQKPANLRSVLLVPKRVLGLQREEGRPGQSGGVLMAAWSSHAVVRLSVLELVVQKEALLVPKKFLPLADGDFFFLFLISSAKMFILWPRSLRYKEERITRKRADHRNVRWN